MLEAQLHRPDLQDGTTVPGRLPLPGNAAITATRLPWDSPRYGAYTTDASKVVPQTQEQWSFISGRELLLLDYRARGSKDSASPELMKQLDALSGLEPGWDSYDAPPPDQQTIESARDFLVSLLSRELGPSPVRVCASVEGGVGIVFQRGSRYADVEFLNDGSIVGGASGGSGPVDVAEWRDGDTKEMRGWISDHL